MVIMLERECRHIYEYMNKLLGQTNGEKEFPVNKISMAF